MSLTVNHSYNEIVGNFGGFADQGYVHATRSQFCGLLGALGDPIVDCFSVTHTDDPLDPGNSLELVNKLGVTNSSGDYYSTLGLFDDGSTGGNLASLGCIVAGSLGDCKEVGYELPGSGQTTLNAGDITLNLGPTIGHFLVRRAATIPEPDTFALLLGGLTVFAGFRRRRRKG